MSKLFAEPSVADPHNFRMAASLAEESSSVPSESQDLVIADTGIDQAPLVGALNHAVASLTESQIHPTEIDPTTSEIIAAAFRQGNMMVSAITSRTLNEKLFPTPGAKQLSNDQLIAKVKEDGLMNYLSQFIDVYDEAQYAAKVEQLIREEEDQKILAASGVPGILASVAAGVVDIPTLLPVGAGVRAAQTAVKAATRVGGAAAGQAALSESVLQASQETRSGETSAINIGASIVLGSGLGIAAHKIASPSMASRIERKLNETLDDARAGSPKAQAAGAQAVTTYQSLRDRGLLDTERVNALGTDAVLKNLGTPFSKLGLKSIDQGLRNPVLDLMDSPSPAARTFVQQFVAMPWITKANAEGVANPQNVAGLVSQTRGRLAGWFREADTEWKNNKAAYANREDFAERVYYAAINGDIADDGDEFVTHAAERLRQAVFEPIRKSLVEAGLLTDEAAVTGAKSYVPRVYNRTAVAAKKERFLELAEEWAFSRIQVAVKNGDEGVPVAEAAQRKAAVEAAQDIFSTITATKPRDVDYAPTTATRGFLKGRSFDVPDKVLADEGYLIKNVFDLAQRYVRTAGTDSAIAQVFKKVEAGVDDAGNAVEVIKGDVKLSSVLSKVNEEFDGLISRSSGADLEKLKLDRDRIIRGIENLRDIARGTFLPEHGGDMARTAELVSMFNFVRMLGGTVASSFTDPINLVIANGFGRTVSKGIAPLLTDFRAAMRSSSNDMRRLGRLAGAVTELEFNSRMAQLGDFDDLYATGDKALSFMRKTANTFSKISGIAYWNTFWKQVAYNVTQARIIDNLNLGLDKLSKPERAWMASLGIGQDEAVEIAEAYSKQVGRKVVAGIPYANHEIWPQGVGDRFRSALANEANNVIITPQLGDRPIFASTPIGRLLFQFRGFMLASQARLIGRNAQLAVLDESGERRLGFASGLFGLVFASAIIDGVKRALSSNDADFDKFITRWKEQPGESLYRSIDRANIFGVIFEGSNIVGRAGGPSIQSGLEYAFGDVGNKSSRSTSLLSALGVPTINLIDDLGHLGFSDLPKLVSEGELTKAGFRRARGLVPFQNVPVVQQTINEFQREVGTIFDWPDGQ